MTATNTNRDISKIILNILEVNEPLKLTTTEILEQLESLEIKVKNTTLFSQLNNLKHNGFIDREETPTGVSWSKSDKQHRIDFIMTERTPRIDQLEKVFLENPKLTFSLPVIRDITGWENHVNINSVLKGLMNRGTVKEVFKDGKRLYQLNDTPTENKRLNHHLKNDKSISRIDQIEKIFLEHPKEVFTLGTLRIQTNWPPHVNIHSILLGLIKRGTVERIESEGKKHKYRLRTSTSKAIAHKKETKIREPKVELLPKESSITDLIAGMEQERNTYKAIIEEILQVLEKHHVLEE